MNVKSPFADEGAARRYARARPYYHPRAIHEGRGLLGTQGDFLLCIDVGSGTGMSTLAAREIAERVIGVEPAAEMLRQARLAEGISFVQASAERLPFDDGVCDLVTAGASLHWSDPHEAMAEIGRVLRPGGALMVYTDRFRGELRGQSALREWMEQEYWPYYPSPPRHRFFDDDLVRSHGLEPVGASDFECDFRMDADSFSDYLLSQSNSLSRIAAGATTAEDLKVWITENTQQWFPSYAIFRGQVWCARAL